ncbi:FHA domain-containing protein [Streptomyces solaniscabiei]|uniref:FHA domain-containing protein n=5 Tax=Streptomyces solaniscabiei TaxID=2683255 RepID=UPI001CE36705|nr:FHA domain-containing protein [Streptomyces solaniscabiei]
MQIRLTVVDPLGPHVSTGGSAPAASCDVLVTAPAGTALAAVASALASVVPGSDGQGSGQVVLYAGAQRLDAQRSTLGEPPLIDGAVLCLGAPGEPDPHTEPADVPAQLHVVAGPDAGGVHLLHGGQIRLGRSADADVALDDPDVSRMHCAVTVAADGRVSVADLGSTNGTTLDGTRVGERPVRFAPGALLRIGESALRLVPAARGAAIRVATTPDGEGYVRLPGTVTDGDQVTHGRVGDGADLPAERTHHAHGTAAYGTAAAPAGPPLVPGQGAAPRIESHGTGFPGDAPPAPPGGAPRPLPGAGGPRSGAAGVHDTHAGAPGTGSAPAGATGAGWGYAGMGDAGGPGRAGATDARGAGRAGASGTDRGHEEAYGTDRGGEGRAYGADSAEAGASGAGAGVAGMGGRLDAEGPTAGADPAGAGRKGTPLRGTDVPQGVRRRGGLGAWARRLTGGRGAQDAAGPDAYAYAEEAAGPAQPAPPAGASPVPETWPDSASLLLTALGPGPRLWERGPGHPEVLAVRLGTADRMAPGGDAPLPAVPVTVGLREAGGLGLAGPRARLTGLARAVLAQLAALHSPDLLEIVLISADRSRPLAERTAEWSWLGWLPQVRPGHGQDCRLLLAYDRDQAMARAQELLRRLEDHLTDARSGARPPAPAGTIPAQPTAPAQDLRPGGPDASDTPGGSGAVTGTARRPSWARADDGSDPAAGFAGPYTVVVVDGDPGGADVREVMARLALEGPRAGIHVVCLAETAAASPTSPVMQTYQAACAASPVFGDCGAVALLSGDVATTLRLLRVARSGSSPSGPVGHGTVGTVDAVSPAWAERFARALAPLRTDGAGGERHARVSAPLPQAARLLDELGLARATPASLMARWADAADDAEALGGRAHAVLGAGPRGPVSVDLAAEGPHLLIEGPPGSGRTELLRALVASLASAERPDRLGIVLMDGRDSVGAGNGHGEGLRVCTDVPHVTTHLTANDPVRMREFAQSLSAELKRRAELLGRSDFAEWHTGRELSGRMVSQRTPPGGAGTMSETGDVESPPSSTLRLRPGAARRRTGAVPPLPRLVVVVDDLDALVTPPLGSPGRPAAGSVMRALEAVAREGDRLGVHLVAAAGPGGRTAQTEPARRASLRVVLDAPAAGPDEPLPGRGRLGWADGRSVPFQAGRVTGRIPRTATLRPTVVALEWHRMGDPPARRPVRELGNGPTDLALLASALERAAREVSAAEVPSLL